MKFKQFLIFSFLFFPAIFSIAQETDSYSSYLKENTLIYSEDDGIMPKSDYSRYKLFVTGEYHYNAENSKIFLKTFRNLYRNANVRMIFFEAGFAYGIVIQHYLETGDYKSLKLISQLGQFDEFHYRFLKDFYDGLPEDDKFKVVGIDIDNYTIKEAFRYAVDLQFRDTIMPEDLSLLLDEFDEITSNERYEIIQNSFGKIYSDFNQNSEKYKLLLKCRYLDYEELIERTYNSLSFDYYDYNRGKDSVAQSKRENFIYRNVLRTIKENPDVNYYGQFGLAHIGLSRFLIMDESSGVESFISKLNNYDRSPIKDSVCAIAILYFDDYYGDYNKLYFYWSQWRYSSSLRDIIPVKVYKILKRIPDNNSFYYVNLSKKESPLYDFSLKNFQYLIFKR